MNLAEIIRTKNPSLYRRIAEGGRVTTDEEREKIAQDLLRAIDADKVPPRYCDGPRWTMLKI